MPNLLSVKPIGDYQLELVYDDGVSGRADLSDLAGKGVFSAWQDKQLFSQVKIGEFGELTWGNNLELCPDSLYLQITGKAPEEVFPALRASSHA
jgi:hypothetical protein